MSIQEIEQGTIRLAAETRPALQPGTYSLHVKQEISGDSQLANSRIKDAFYSFSCEADPFFLDSGQIYSVYPPKDSFGMFERTLPHMVLKRRTLPWERDVPGVKGAPWLALLLFGEGEKAEVRTVTDRDRKHQILEVEAGLFQRVCPRAEDLPLSAHARCVSREDKVTEKQPLDEWMSVLTANRLPVSGPGENGLKNTVYLVSVEGVGKLLSCPEELWISGEHGQNESMRLPLLASWSFYSRKVEFNFKALFEKLTAGVLIPPAVPGACTRTKTLLDRGFVPLNHRLRDGGRTVSWYHGPFRSWPLEKQDTSYQLFSDAGLIYDPELRMFDISVSAAFNLGRMLAMKDRSFAAAFDRYRQENKREAFRRSNRRMMVRALESPLAGEKAEQLESSHDQLQGLMDHMLEEILLRSADGAEAGNQRLYSEAQKAGNTGRSWVGLNGYTEGVFDFLKQADEAEQMPEEIIRPLAAWSLLYEVPYRYLVPGEYLLPPESIRFFTIDQNWLFALLDGAMSLGRLYDVDYDHDSALIERILEEVYQARCSIRPALQGKRGERKDKAVRQGLEALKQNGRINTGFLLRSSMVAGWRGLEFRAYSDSKKQDRLEPLRIETLGPDVLLGIFPGICSCLEIRQPPEEMHFGFEDKPGGGYRKLLRSLDTGALYDREPVYADVVMKDVELGVMNFADTAKNIMLRLLPGTSASSAHMALEMIQNPASGEIKKI